jgi:hypothetical protein
MPAQSGELQAAHADVVDDCAARSMRRPFAVARYSFVAARAESRRLLLSCSAWSKRKPRCRSSRRTTWPVVRGCSSEGQGALLAKRQASLGRCSDSEVSTCCLCRQGRARLRPRSRFWRNSGLSRPWPRDLSRRESGATDLRRPTRLRVHPVGEKRVFRADRSPTDRSITSRATLLAICGSFAATRQDTCVRGFARLSTGGFAMSGGVLIAGSLHLHGPRGQCQDWAGASSRTRLSVVQKCWKLRLRMNPRSGSTRRVAPVGCPYTRN